MDEDLEDSRKQTVYKGQKVFIITAGGLKERERREEEKKRNRVSIDSEVDEASLDFADDLIHREEKLEVENITGDKKSYRGFTYKNVFVEFNETAVLPCIELTQRIIHRIQELPKSRMNDQVYHMFETFKPAKLITCTEDMEEAYEIDTTRDYSNAFLNTQIRHFMYDYNCSFVKCSIGSLDQICSGHYTIS